MKAFVIYICTEITCQASRDQIFCRCDNYDWTENMGSEKTLRSTTTVMPGTMCACGRTRQASLKRGLHRREGKGRHFFLGDIIDSIPYCASSFTDLMKRPICNQDELKNRVKFSLFFNSSWCKIASAARNCSNSVL